MWVPLLHDGTKTLTLHRIRHEVLHPRLHLMVHHRHMVSLGHDLHGRLRPDHVVCPLQITCSVKCLDHQRLRASQSIVMDGKSIAHHIGPSKPYLMDLKRKLGASRSSSLRRAPVHERLHEVIREDAPRER